jgi:outer membrane protein assembly factor BamB
MKTINSKIVIIVISLLLLSSIAFPLFASPARASNIISYPFIDAVPNPVGVNQPTLLNFGLVQNLINPWDGWNVTVTYTRPDNTTGDLGGTIMTDSTGATGRGFTPDQVGTYYFTLNFPEQVYNNITYTASKSTPLALVVQSEPLKYYPNQPLPRQYWTRPIDDQLTDWYSIAGSWLTTPPNMYAVDNKGPESGHVLWATPIGNTQGGLAGGETSGYGYGTGDAYEGNFAGSVIIGGILFYNKYGSFTAGSTSPQQTVVAIDLHTGKELWERTLLNNQRLAFGQTLTWDSLNYQGAFSYLWATSGTNWYAFETLTGDWKYNMTNVPSGTNYYGPNGELLKYSVTNIGNTTNPNWRLLQWNSTYVIANGKNGGTTDSWGSQTQGVSYDATKLGYDLNISIPGLSVAGAKLPGNIQKVFPGDKVIGTNVASTEIDLWAVSLKQSTQGTLLYNQTNAAPSEWAAGNLTLAGWVGWDQQNNVAVYLTKENRKYYGFSLTDGKYLWQTQSSEVFQDAWDATSGQRVRALGYGLFYSASIGGTVYAYNDTTGALVWTYNSTDVYHQGLYGNNWWTVVTFIVDGKIYIGNMDHSPIMPMWKGAPFVCLNATTGQLIWKVDGMFRQSFWGGRALIGDSIIATQDTFDQRIYAIGKGPTQTTVNAADIAAPYGSPIVLKGSVMDVSPGTNSDSLKLRFPNGVPAVSDDSQSDWMLYVYKQFTAPSNVTGVKVSIDALDPNNNIIHIGDTTTDASGSYSYMFIPQNSGKYVIYSTFEGSNSYYSSYAQTALGVAQQAQATASPLPPAASLSETYFIPSVVAIILAISIVGAVLAVLQLRKH